MVGYRRTKIVCTIGPASESPDKIDQLIDAGMNVARLNLSHGTLEEHERRLRTVREVSARKGVPVGVLLDIQGPKIRLGEIRAAGGSPTVRLEPGSRVTLTSEPVVGDGSVLPVGYDSLPRAVRPGSVIYLDDGLIELRAESVEGPRVVCRVEVGGEVRSRKGVALPGVQVDLPPLTEADREHIRWGVAAGADFVAASFVRQGPHVEAVREEIRRAGGDIPVIAKIESQEGLHNLDEIVAAADGVMVARGDLGVDIPLQEVPLAQKMIIARTNAAGKPVITATQMLESMVRSHRPTRAEVADVANAILDGTDAVMLSGETAVGLYPVQAVRVMHRVASRVEQDETYRRLRWAELPSAGQLSVAEAISHATCQLAYDLRVAAILSSTQSGATARMVARFRPHAPIIAATPDPAVVRRLTLIWGVRPLLVPRTGNIDDMVDAAVEAAKASGLIGPGDLVAITAGVKTDTPGSTNLLQVYEVH